MAGNVKVTRFFISKDCILNIIIIFDIIKLKLSNMTNKEQFQYRLEKSLKNNLALRLLEKCKQFALTGETLSSASFTENISCKHVDPESLLQRNCINLWYDESPEDERRLIDEFWDDEYSKFGFAGGQINQNPLEYLNFDTLADSMIYLNWCGFSQHIKMSDETNLKNVK